MPRKPKTYIKAVPKYRCPQCDGEGWKRIIVRGNFGRNIETVIRCECVKFIRTTVGNQPQFRKSKDQHDGKAKGAGE